MALHSFHQLTFQLLKKKLERGLCFHILLLEVSCVCYCHHFPCQFATYLSIWRRGSRAVLALCRSLILYLDIYYFLLAGTSVLVSPRETHMSQAISAFREFTI